MLLKRRSSQIPEGLGVGGATLKGPKEGNSRLSRLMPKVPFPLVMGALLPGRIALAYVEGKELNISMKRKTKK
jgi:hypothetical protein